MPADLVLIAIGFVHPAHDDVVAGLGLDTDKRGNVAAKTFETSRAGRLRGRRRPRRPVADRHRDRRGPPLRARVDRHLTEPTLRPLGARRYGARRRSGTEP